MSDTIPSNSRHILTPTKLNRLARTLLQSEIGMIWLTGEISNFVAAASGHWYFTLKDNKAQIRGAMFRQANNKVVKRPKEGDKVLLRASVSLYEPRGDYQLIVEHMEAEGEGALKRELEQLKLRLNREGLFDAQRKRPLPEKRARIGVITSASGAALHDVLTVLKRRSPDLEVIVYPSLVQGEQAPQALINALRIANERKEVDLLLLTRGGGSLEDLWAFNDANLARHIFESQLVVVSAVGHEVDITISDMVADMRAPTPSAAAELVSPDRNERERRCASLTSRLTMAISTHIKQHRSAQEKLTASLRLLHPSRQFMQNAQHIDALTLRLNRAFAGNLTAKLQRKGALQQQLIRQHPAKLFEKKQALHSETVNKLAQAWQSIREHKSRQLEKAASHLHAISPLATLSRGYTISLQGERAVTSAKHVDRSKPLITRFQDGEIISMPTSEDKAE